MNYSTFLPDEAATEAFGQALAACSKSLSLITLSGDLGSGKTTLVRGLIRALGHDGAVKSPTFTVIEPYELQGRPVMHLDLYRLEDPEELEFLGFRDMLDGSGLCLIEWPERARQLLPPADLRLQLSLENKGRRLQWQAETPAGESVSTQLLESCPPQA